LTTEKKPLRKPVVKKHEAASAEIFEESREYGFLMSEVKEFCWGVSKACQVMQFSEFVAK